MFSVAANVVETGLGAVKRLAALASSGMFKDNLIDYTKVSRVEPVMLVDADVTYYDNLSEVTQSLLSIFAGYYMQAVALSMSVGKIHILSHLDQLNPTRDPIESLAWKLGQEEYKDRLYVPYQIACENVAGGQGTGATSNATMAELAAARLEMEKEKAKLEREKFEHTKAKDAKSEAKDKRKEETDAEKDLITKQALLDKQDSTDFGIGRDSLATLKELTNLSVGKVFSVDLTDGNHKTTLPITIRLLANMLPTASLIHILSINSQDKLNTYKERFHDWRSGRLTFWKDLVFCQDLINAHRKNLMHDKEGIYTELVNRNKGNQLAGALTKTPSLANASNLVVTSTETIQKLETHLEGRFSDFKVREKVFQATYLMIVAVIDKQFDRVTFYHRGIHLPTELSIRDIKSSNKSGPDVSDILRAYQLGNAPSL